MFFYLYAQNRGWKEAVRSWLQSFRQHREFRRVFFLSFYVSMVLLKTLICRNMSQNPLRDIVGTWGLWDDAGRPYTEGLENLILFIPLISLLFWAMPDWIFKSSPVSFFTAVFRAVQISFFFSLTIEFSQLFFKLGTFQLSDLFYNTAGGMLGGIFYYCFYRGQKRKDEEYIEPKWNHPWLRSALPQRHGGYISILMQLSSILLFLIIMLAKEWFGHFFTGLCVPINKSFPSW